MQTFYAHIREDGAKETVEGHLTGTAELCRDFASEFNAGEQGYLTGMLHDIGKYSEDFQQRLLNNAPKVDHSTAGAFECCKIGQHYAAFCIAGHHGGLPDGGGKMDNSDSGTFNGRMNRAGKGNIPCYSKWTDYVEVDCAKNQSVQPPTELAGGIIGLDFYTRMLFSCLTDADYLKTEEFMNDGKVERGGGEPVTALVGKADEYVSKWYPPNNELNRQRCNILKQCISNGDDEALKSGIFTLTVPTGGGKTVASLAFALHHAKTHGKKRVIYVIPYTSIIEQTSDIFRKILGDENVLEHHSGVLFDVEDEATPENQRMMRATENWDKPVVVTTAVQFFESVYSNRPSKCRKLHNLANSVIIFDEAQMLPISQLRPCVSAITQLVGNFGASAVLCTATQPALGCLIHEFLPSQEITELCPKDIYDPSVFRRVTFDISRVDEKASWSEIAEQMRESTQALCIVNTRKSAKELYSMLRNIEGVYHLSTLMVPEHRRKYLEEIKQRLKDGLPCRVVSTSLIEAGVDVDFPLVFREIAGLDSIIQAAGRCNREGLHTASESRVVVFQSETAIPQLFEKNAGISKDVFGEFPDDISSDEAISCYFEQLLYFTGGKALDRNDILDEIESGKFPFATIAKNFRLIDDNTVTVYIPWGEGRELIERMKRGEYSRGLFREAAQYSVSVYDRHFKNLCACGAVAKVDERHDLWYLINTELYCDADGLRLDADTGQAVFA